MFRSIACLALCLLTSLTFAQDDAAKTFSKSLAKMELKDGDSVVFLGDSITHQCLYTQYVEDYFYTRHPNMRIKFHNAGVGGARAWDALQRFDRDVADYKPKYVTVLLGMNDGSYQPYNQSVFDTYKSDMNEVVEKIVACGAQPVLMTPTMFDARAARMGKRPRSPEMMAEYNSVLAYYGGWLRDVAGQTGYGFVDMYSPLNNITWSERKKDENFTLIKDAVHPGADGQLVMAAAIIEDMGLKSSVSNIRIMEGANGKVVARATGGKLTDLEATADRVSFTWAARSLPLALPEEASTGAKLLRIGHRMSREALGVYTLSPGTYKLAIDDVEVGEYTDVQLARQVELQSNAKTPQHQQALAVTNLNKERNAGPVRKKRGEWSQFQRYARAKRDSAANPDNAQMKKQVAALTTKIEGMEERVAAAEEEAKKLEDRIFELNQPKPRKYVLTKVK